MVSALHDDVQYQFALRLLQYTLPFLETHHLIYHHNTVGRVELDVVLAIDVGRCGYALSLDAYDDHRYGLLILIDNGSAKFDANCVGGVIGSLRTQNTTMPD